jgi:hypothetical protein
MFPQLIALHKEFAGNGVDFKMFSVDDEERVAEVPPFLAIYQAPFAAVRVQPWQSGQLSANLSRLGLNVGMQWNLPLIAWIDRRGEVLWQAQGPDDLAELRSLMRAKIAVQAAAQ